MKDNIQKNHSDIGQLGNVDQIREILFGSQTRELNKRFEKLESDFKRSFDELKNKIDQNQKDINLRIDNEFESKIKNSAV